MKNDKRAYDKRAYNGRSENGASPNIRRKPAWTGFILPALFAAGLVLAGCQTVQDDLLIASADEKTYEGLAELEEAVVRLDGAGADRESLVLARDQIAGLQGTAADPGFEALLSAWAGRLSLMEGKRSDAQAELEKSQTLSPLNLPSQILSFKMERDPSKRLPLIDRSLETEGPAGELLIERGRTLFDLNRFSESVAAFDAAFALLGAKPYYEEAYGIFRNKAWELKDLRRNAGGKTMEIAGKEAISWRDLIEAVKSETQLFRFITAGQDWPAETLFNHLLDRSLIPLTQNAALAEWPFSKPASSETVLRSGAAWFFWHLNAENKANRGLLTSYSARFANIPNARSPVADVDISSPFIDSVLGCVEAEFMNLPDGRNFRPGETAKGSDCLAALKKFGP